MVFIKDLGRLGNWMTLITGVLKETSCLFQLLAIAVQRFNTIVFRGSFAQPELAY